MKDEKHSLHDWQYDPDMMEELPKIKSDLSLETSSEDDDITPQYMSQVDHAYISFKSIVGSPKVKILKCEENDDVSDVLKSLGIPLEGPCHVISIVGGTENYVSYSQKKRASIFADIRGVFPKEEHTLVITCGIHNGVVEIVGEVVKSLPLKHGQLVCLGIVSKDTMGLDYINHPSSILTHRLSRGTDKHTANPYHTHLLRVTAKESDDWFRRGRWFRGQLEYKLAKLTTRIKSGLPVFGENLPDLISFEDPERDIVLFTIGGGLEAIVEIAYALNHSQPVPVVLFKDTGGASDFIENILSEVELTHGGYISYQDIEHYRNHSFLVETNRYQELSDDEERRLWHDIENIIKNRDLVQIYDPENDASMGNDDVSTDIHEAIMWAKVKCQLKLMNRQAVGQATKDCNVPNALLTQASLPVTISIQALLDVKDHAQELVLKSLMTQELRAQGTQTIAKLIKQGYFMEKYLTLEILSSELYGKDKSKWDESVSRVRHHIEKYYRPGYTSGNINFKTVSLGLYQSPIDTRKNTTVSNPFQELFVWAIVSRRFDLADYAWENVDDPIMTSLMARLVLQTEATKLSPREQRKRDQYFEYSRIYEKRAFNLIEPENLEKDETLEYNLILRERHANWCSFSCLDIGLKAKAKMFLSHDCCQYALRKLWLGKISIRYSSITLFFIFCIYWLVAISTRSESVFDSDFRRSKRFEKSRTGYLKSCIAFYGAPVNKFSLHVVAFISFLFLYAYVVMYCPLARMFTLPDLIAHVWLLIYFIEVLREMVYVYPYGRRVSHLDHFIDWWKSSWNILNFLIMLVATIAFSCRWFVTTTLTRFLYASSYFLIMLNILRLYTISKHLGPMVSMLKHMFIRTLNFAMVFVVFLVGYAVAVQALLYQQAGKSLSLMILSDMFFMPFFQTFGELFTDSLPENGDSTTPASLTAVLYSLLMAVYLFIGNVLLLNLLIAIFSRDIERVQEEAEEVWKFELYVLHNEYERKPILPPPLTLIIYIYWIIVYIFKRCHTRGYCGFTAHKRNSRQNRKLIEFRKMCLSRYLANKKEMERNSLEARTDRIEQASQNLLELNEAIVDNTVKIRTKSRHIKKHTKIIDHKTENINETTAAINLTTDTIENMAVRLKESGTNLRKTTDNIAAGQEILSSQMYDVHHRLDQLHTKNALLRACKVDEMKHVLQKMENRLREPCVNSGDPCGQGELKPNPDVMSDAVNKMEELILILMDFIKEISKKEDLDNKNLQNDSGYMEDRNMSAKKALYCDKKQFPVANIETKTSTPLDGRNIVKRSLVKEFQRMKITDPTVRKRKNRMHVSESELSDAPEYQGCQEFTPRRRCNRLQRKKYRQYDFNPTIPSKLIDKMKCSPLISSIHHYLGLGESGNIELIGTLKSGPKFNPTFGYKK